MKTFVLGSMVLSLFFLAPSVRADTDGKPAPVAPTKIYGTVSKAQPGLTVVKTPAGEIAFLSGLESLKVGEEVEMQVNADNSVIGVNWLGRGINAPVRAVTKPGNPLLYHGEAANVEPGLIF